MNNKKTIFILILFLIAISAVFFLVINQSGRKAPAKIYHVGLLQMVSTINDNIEGFKAGMKDLGYVEGENIIYDYYNAEGKTELLKQYAQKFVDENVDMIFVNSSPATQAAMEVTANTNIPVVFSMVADPLGAGFVKSIKSSGNNLTGTSCAYIDIAPKRLEILKEINPKIKKILVFYRPEDKSGGPATAKIQETGPKIGIEIVAKAIKSVDEIKQNLAVLKPGDVDAIMDPADSVVTAGLTEWGVDKAKELKIPLFMLSKIECEKGALASYGVDYTDLGKQSSLIANQVLAGIEPTNIPIEMPRKFYFAVNLQTAEAIGLKIPEKILYKADLIIK